jgi:hypothetical protein
MCFSASASFIASGVTGAGGLACLKSTRRKSEIPLASIPFLFAIQQFIEGLIWIYYPGSGVADILTPLYSFFSHVLWPLFIPIAIYLVEPSGRRKKLLLSFMILGISVSIFLFYFIIQNPAEVSVAENHLRYSYGYLENARISVLLYLTVVSISPLFSSHRILKVFGVLLFFSFLVAFQSYNPSFFSIWCFFAAGLSLLIYLHFKYRHRLTLHDYIEKLDRTLHDRF